MFDEQSDVQMSSNTWCWMVDTLVIVCDFTFKVTVNSEIFARVLFSRSFVKIKSTRNGEINMSFTDKG